MTNGSMMCFALLLFENHVSLKLFAFDDDTFRFLITLIIAK